MERAQFEKMVAEGFDAIPEKFRQKVQNVVFLVEDEPSEKVRREENLTLDETLFGLYTGQPLSERGDLYGVGMTMPDTILIYQNPIEEVAHENIEHRVFNKDVKHSVFNSTEKMIEDEVRKIVAETVWHEIAHHFGFNEAEVRMRERLREAGISGVSY